MADVQGVTGAAAGGAQAGSGAESDQSALSQINAETAQATATDQRYDIEDAVTGGINPRTLTAKLHAAQAATTAATGAGFQFTPEQIETQLKQCKDLSIQYGQVLREAQAAEANVHEPAPDHAGSLLQASQTKASLTNLQGVIRDQISFLSNWQATLAKVKADYLEQEHVTEDQWQRLAKGVQA